MKFLICGHIDFKRIEKESRVGGTSLDSPPFESKQPPGIMDLAQLKRYEASPQARRICRFRCFTVSWEICRVGKHGKLMNSAVAFQEEFLHFSWAM